jgi:dehydrogenase/reductase SDR family protein 12
LYEFGSAVILETLADLSVIGAYTRLGYALRARRFDPADLAVDLAGRVFVVTGASTGLGLAAATAFAERGADVVLVARPSARLDAAREAVAAVARGGKVVAEGADLSLVRESADLADRLGQRGRIDALVLNAGVMIHERRLTDEGNEVTFATNVLSGFLLQHRLEANLRAASGRVVHVTSGGMYTQRLDLAKLQGDIDPWDGVVSYAQTKRAQVVLNRLWAARYAGTGLTSNAMHPGWADTPGVVTSLPAFHRVLGPWLRTPEQGADTAVWLAASPAAASVTGQLWLDRIPRREHVFPGTRAGDTLGPMLWALCCERCGIDDVGRRAPT